MKSLNTNKVFFSAQAPGLTELENQKRHTELTNELDAQGLTYRLINGMYKGQKEVSVMIEADGAAKHLQNLSLAINLAERFGQESILEVGNDNTTFVHYLDEFEIDRIGVMSEATKEEAEKQDAYSQDVLTGRFFIVS